MADGAPREGASRFERLRGDPRAQPSQPGRSQSCPRRRTGELTPHTRISSCWSARTRPPISSFWSTWTRRLKIPVLVHVDQEAQNPRAGPRGPAPCFAKREWSVHVEQDGARRWEPGRPEQSRRAISCPACQRDAPSAIFASREVRVQERYERAWRDYRWRWWSVWGLAYGFMGVAIGTSALLPGTLANAVIYCWVGAWGLSGLRLGLFRCPACGKCFHLTSWLTNILSRRCLHCGLPKYQEPAEVSLSAPTS